MFMYSEKIMRTMRNGILLCATLPCITACVFEPAPVVEAPPPPGFVVAPGYPPQPTPGYAIVQEPCCYSYPEYPPYYYGPGYGGYYGPPVSFGVGVGFGGGHGGGWHGGYHH